MLALVFIYPTPSKYPIDTSNTPNAMKLKIKHEPKPQNLKQEL